MADDAIAYPPYELAGYLANEVYTEILPMMKNTKQRNEKPNNTSYILFFDLSISANNKKHNAKIINITMMVIVYSIETFFLISFGI